MSPCGSSDVDIRTINVLVHANAHANVPGYLREIGFFLFEMHYIQLGYLTVPFSAQKIEPK